MNQPSSDPETHPPAASGSQAASTAMSLAQSLCIGSIGYRVVSTVVFATVAYGARILIPPLARWAGLVAGRCLRRAFVGHAGMIAWGVLFGRGLGFGLGYVFYAGRAPSRAKPQPAR